MPQRLTLRALRTAATAAVLNRAFSTEPTRRRYPNTALVVIAAIAAIAVLTHDPQASGATTLTVNSTGDANDTNPGNGICATSGSVCTLRAAIQEANALTGTDTINFNIPQTEPGYLASPQSFTIKLGTLLPEISTPMVIDGSTQPEYATQNRPVVVIDGGDVSAGEENGLWITGGGTTVRALALHRFGDDAIDIEFNGGNTIVGNYVGIHVDGTTARPNAWGINIKTPNNIVGGANAADRNVVSGNQQSGLYIYSSATGNVIQGNYVGTTASGAAALPNLTVGFDIHSGATGNTIGGTGANEGNVISGNNGHGIEVRNETSDANIITGNRIGTNAAGTAALANGGDAININGGPDSTRIADNLIAHTNGDGIQINGSTTGTIIQGNSIGTNPTRTATWPGRDAAISIENGASNTTIGGAAPGDPNIIANAGTNPASPHNITIWATAGSGNSILGNAIYDAQGLGINLVGSSENGFAVTANDSGDGDSGPNDLLNYPVITSAIENAGTVTVTFDLDAPAGNYRVEFFDNNTADPSGHGEGETFRSAVTVAPGTGRTHTFAGTVGDIITATATRDFGGTYGSTSEFSATRTATAAPAPVVLEGIQKGTSTLTGGSSSVTSSIAAVDPAKAFLVFGIRGNNASPSNITVTGELTNATTLTFRRPGTTGTVAIEWSVVEFSSGVTVQRGTTTLSAATTDIPISSVDPTTSFPLISQRSSGGTFGETDFPSATLTSSTNLRISIPLSSANDVAWQVVTYNDAIVQSGGVTFEAGDTTRTATVTAVDPAKAWLTYSTNTEPGTSANIGQKLVRGRVTNGTTLTFDRSSTGQKMNVTWHLVEFTDATEVQHANVAFASADTTKNATITSVDPSRSIATGGYLTYGGRSAYTSDDNPGVGWFTTRLSTATNLRIQRSAALAAADLGWSVVHWPGPGAPLTVNATGDATDNAPGDGYCWTGANNTAGARACTLRAAITEANANPFIDAIDFAIPASEPGHSGGVWTITPGSGGLPAVTGTVTIDATTQPGWVTTPVVELNGAAAGTGADGLRVASDGSTIRGLAINRFDADGIEINTTAANTTIAGNHIGLDPTGLIDRGNGERGIDLQIDSGPTTIGGTGTADRNVISGNGGDGIIIYESDNNTIIGNYIGTDVTGNASGTGIGNGSDGITLANGTTSANNTIGQPGAGNIISGNGADGVENDATGADNTIQANTIGLGANGTTPIPNGRHGIVLYNGANNTLIGGNALTGEGNTISANTQEGIRIDGNDNPLTADNTITGNLIGTDTTGLLDRGNGTTGINMFSDVSTTTIGGSTPGLGNVIAGHGQDGIYLQGVGTDDTTILGNYIGVDAGGNTPIPNGDRGVQIESGANNTTVGTPAAGNVIGASGNDGIIISDGAIPGTGTTGTVIENNNIGVGADGTTPVGNGTNGVRITTESNHTIGGPTPGQGNLIAHNTQDGVMLQDSTAIDNTILGNSIHSNGQRGIDLGNDDVTTNDPGDGDAGANDLLNHPVIATAVENAGTVTVTFDLDAPAGNYRIEFFDNTTPDPSGHGEGETFRSAVTVAPGTGRTHTFPGTAGDIITATTTQDLGAGSYGSTSEFSATVTAVAGPVTISGTVFEDIVGDGLSDGSIGDANNPGLAGIDVALVREGPSPMVADASGDVGRYTSVGIGGDGNPIVSYHDVTNADLRVLHCDDPLCQTHTTTAVDSAGAVGQYTSLAIGTDGLAIISYHDATATSLRVAHCQDAACSTAITTTVDNSASVGTHSSIAIGTDGLAIISYYDATNTSLRVAHCDNISCTSSTTRTVHATGDVGQYSSLTIGADGLAVMSYYDATNGDLRLAHCDDVVCSSSTTGTVDTLNDVGTYSSVVIAPDGFPRIVSLRPTDNNLRFVQCLNVTCSTRNLNSVPAFNTWGGHFSLTIATDGETLIAGYDSGAQQARLVTCNAANCGSSSNIRADYGNDVGQFMSVALDAAGSPIMAYYDATNGDLKLGVRDGQPSINDRTEAIQITDGSGNYTFSGVPRGLYMIAAHSRDAQPTAGYATGGAGDVWAEQTHGPTGAFCADGAGGTTAPRATAGPCFGGRREATSDASTLSFVDGAEHVALIDASAGAIADIDFGFSFNIVTTTNGGNTRDDDFANNRTVQGSLRQFIQNANATSGNNSLRFVPVSTPNATSGSDQWWQIAVTNPLPPLTDPGTVIDGTAHDLTDGTTTRQTNTRGPELELDGSGTTPTTDGLTLTGGTTTVTNLVINRFGRDGIRSTGSSDNTITGNYIGTNATGTTSLGNGRSGIRLETSSTNNRIGGPTAPEANLIAGNLGDGVALPDGAAVDNTILGNSIFGNGGLGIDLGDDDVTPNDNGDGDSGANDHLNYPVIAVATETAGTVSVDFDLDAPAGNYRVEFFDNAGADSSGHGEGETLLGAVTITPGTARQYSFPGAAADIITATVTEDLGGGAYGPTSEFSAAVTVAPVLDSDGDGLWDHEEDANTDLDNDPSTNPGPDTDGDTFPNHLDPDDDDDGFPTASENPDPNADGDPRDALDADGDAQADYLDAPTDASIGRVADEQKISDTSGGLAPGLGVVDHFGRAVASIGDLDRDGIVDLAVGVPFDDDGSSDRGAVYILFLNGDGTVRTQQKISDTAGGFSATLDNSDEFGTGVAGLGDLNGDGVNDIVVGAHQDDDGGGNFGAVYVLFLNTDGTVKAEQKISATQGGLAAAFSANNRFGSSVANIGDLDGDGLPDIVVGASDDDDGAVDAGAAFVLFLNGDGTVRAEQKISDTAGGLTAALTTSDHFGVGVAGLGDIDGDGLSDIAVGSDLEDDGGTNRGAVHILFLNTDGTVKAEQKISNTTGGLTATLDNGDQFGAAVSAAGDVDADGVPDLVVGAPRDGDGSSLAGAVYVLFLNTDGTVKTEQKISNTAGGLTATLDGSDQFGIAVAGLGDLDGDTTIGIAVGVFGDDDGGPSDRGAVFVLDLAPPLALVNSTGDAGDLVVGDGVCDTGGTNSEGDPECTLRAAIEEANDPAGPFDTIEFAIPTSDPNYSASPLAYTLTPSSQFPFITDPVTIDASTQPGWTGDPIIELDGSGATGASGGLILRANDSTIRGFIVHSFVDEGLEIDGSTGFGDNNVLTNNWVGFDPGLNARPNADTAVLITVGAASNTIGGTASSDTNVIGHGANAGILIRNAGSDDNVVIGNIIGRGPDGTTTMPNTTHGVEITDLADGNRIGGPTAAEANLISGNLGDGVSVSADAGTGNSFLGNSIFGNGGLGIDLGDDDVTPNSNADVWLDHPVIESISESGGIVFLLGTFDVPAGSYRFEFFTNPSGGDPSGHGEGQQLVGTATLSHSGSGPQAWGAAFPGSVGDTVSVTLTEDLGGGSYGATSEFSANAVVPLAITVNSTGDDSDLTPGDGVCDTGGTVGSDPECTLRAAIEETNAPASPIDTIWFAIPVSDPGYGASPVSFTITPSTPLPTITRPVMIDGSTQAEAAAEGHPVIELDGSTAGGTGLTVSAGDSTIRGLVVNRFATGILLTGGDTNVVAGNHIGTDVTGLAGEVGNTTEGIQILQSADNLIGGTQAEDGNVIAGNRQRGIIVDDWSDGATATSAGTQILGNHLGVGADGVTAIPYNATAVTQQIGIYLLDASTTVIGSPGAGNVLSGNDWYGIYTWGPNTNATTIQGNTIGLDATGTSPVPNGTNNPATRGGILVSNAPGTLIGGTGIGEGNTVAGNDAAGVIVSGASATDTAILSNAFADNNGLGIDLGGDGVTSNDAGDADTGPNDLLNHPVLRSATRAGSSSVVEYELDVPAGTYRVEFFVVGAPDPSGYGEGLTLAADETIVTAGTGVELFSAPTKAVTGDLVTATITEDPAGPGFGATSEFANVIPVRDPASTIVDDASARRSDLAPTGGLDVSTPGPGIVGDGVSLDGADDALRAPATDITDGAWSLSGWFNATTFGTDPRIAAKATTDGNAAFELLIDDTSPTTGQATARLRLGAATHTVTGGTLTTGTWHQIAATWDSATLTLIVDGVAVDTTPATGTIHTDITVPLTIGNLTAANRGLNGAIDEVRLNHRAHDVAWFTTEHTNLTTPTTFVTVGAEQTALPDPWTVTGTQTRSGSFALTAPTTDPGDPDAWVTATGITEPGVEFTTWWWTSTTTGIDLAAGTRTGATPTDQYDTALTAPTGWDLATLSGPTRTVDAPPAGSPSTGTWVEVTIRTDETGNSSIWIDNTEVTAPTPHSTSLDPGSIGLRTGLLPTGQTWYIDDARARKLIAAEPTTTLGPLDRY